MTSLLTDSRLRSWLSGAVLTTCSLTRSKPWRWSWISGETPLLSAHSPSWTALWLQWSHSVSWAPQFLRSWSGTITLSPLWKRPSRGCTFLRQLRKFKPATGAADTVLLCHHWIRPLHVNNCLVQLSYQIWPQDYGTTLPTLQELYLSRVSKRAGKITLDPSHPAHSLFELLPSGHATELWAPERPDKGTVSSPSNPSHEHLTLNTIYIIYSSHILIFSFQICTYQTCTHIIVYIIYCVFAILYIAYLYIILYYLYPVLLLSFCCTVELLSL